MSSPREESDYIPNLPQPSSGIPNRMNPNFYKENEEVTAALGIGPTPPQSAVKYPNVPETRDIEDSDGENEEYKNTAAMTAKYIPPPQVSSIDEDYDT
jgi:hypothetical protein